MSNLSVVERDSVLVVDSRLIAQELGIQHKNLLETLSNYLGVIETAFGAVAFQTREFKTSQGNNSTERFAYLTEDQATLLMTFSRNTPQVVQCKVNLVKAFSQAKQIIQELNSPELTSRLTQLESDIQSGLALIDQGKTVVWQAVAQIQDEELWREAGFNSFAGYCKERWGWSRSNAYEIAAAGKVVNQLKEIGIPSENMPTAVCQVRPLRRVDEPLRPDIWKQVLETAQSVTAKSVERAVSPPKLKSVSNPNQITAYVDDDLRADLCRLAKRRRRSLSSLIEAVCYQEVEVAKAQGEI